MAGHLCFKYKKLPTVGQLLVASDWLDVRDLIKDMMQDSAISNRLASSTAMNIWPRCSLDDWYTVPSRTGDFNFQYCPQTNTGTRPTSTIQSQFMIPWCYTSIP